MAPRWSSLATAILTTSNCCAAQSAPPTAFAVCTQIQLVLGGSQRGREGHHGRPRDPHYGHGQPARRLHRRRAVSRYPSRALVGFVPLTGSVVAFSGYRIRELSEAERDVQVSQLVARQREWENGLVATYKKFLEICESEIKGGSGCRSIWVSVR